MNLLNGFVFYEILIIAVCNLLCKFTHYLNCSDYLKKQSPSFG
uniref:Uncharacterized protein n=1 Tax=Arundo donax TaxID=35708 RepID=A0A0A8Z9M8_ARUDO